MVYFEESPDLCWNISKKLPETKLKFRIGLTQII